MKLTTMKVQALCIFVLILVVGTSSQKYAECPFHNLYHFGDTSTDIGNAIRIKPWGPHLPAAHLPFGKTYPGYPTGRWSDGLIDFDYTACYYGLPNIVPYLGMNGSTEYDGVIFSVAWSPVLDRSFFESKGIKIPPYVVSLNEQLEWFKGYLNTVESTPEAIAERLKDSVLFTGDLEANDVIYGLTQGKSIEEVKTYVPNITETMIHAIRELIVMGADKILVPGNFPIGCTPYILTELGTDNPDDYDDIGCLDTVNQLIKYKNKDLEEAIENTIHKEFPDALVLYEDGYSFVETYIRDAIDKGYIAFKSCCGVGGKYNYDSKRFCGHPEATVCSNRTEYIWWDGFHDTAATYYSIVSSLIDNALKSLNCTRLDPSVNCTMLEPSSALKSVNYMKLEPSSASM